ncbi:MAG: RsmD family RNA methyltransferase [Puniceicoccaceae bacterium]
MRITGGKAAGVRIHAPGGGRSVRPATDRMREAVFSSLGPDIGGARVLDLFAGTGAYGLEALSRGAALVVWIEADRAAAATLGRNREAVVKSMGGGGLSRVIARDLRRHPFHEDERFDLVFADPPYAEAAEWIPAILSIAGRHLSHEPAGRLLLEIPGRDEPDTPGWICKRRFGRESAGPSLRVLERA